MTHITAKPVQNQHFEKNQFWANTKVVIKNMILQLTILLHNIHSHIDGKNGNIKNSKNESVIG